jgi:predicted Zn-dependent protease
MKNLNQLLFAVLLLFFINIIFVDSSFAQKYSNDSKKSKRNYTANQRSSSSKSSATTNDDRYYSNHKRNYYDSDRNDFSNRRNNETNTKRETKLSRKKNENLENYFHIDKSGNSLWDGKHWEESRFPLNIYVKKSSSRYYKSSYKEYVKYAMDVWRKADDRIQYKFVKSADDADITLIFVENLGDRYDEDYLGLTDYDTFENNEIDYSKIQISLIKNGDEKISAGEIKATIMHELGHAFGLGHSKNEKDLMYPYISPEHTPEMTYDELSRGDKLAIKDVIGLSFDENYVWK